MNLNQLWFSCKRINWMSNIEEIFEYHYIKSANDLIFIDFIRTFTWLKFVGFQGVRQGENLSPVLLSLLFNDLKLLCAKSYNRKQYLSRIVTKLTKWHVRPAKTQISLGIRPVWLEPSLCAQWVAKDPSFLHADNEDSDQTGRTCHFVGFVMSRLKLCSSTSPFTGLPVWF